MMLVTLVLGVSVVSCDKNDDLYDGEQPSQDCNCGVITDDEILTSPYRYTLTIRNNCSSNYATFNVTQSEWFENHVGEYTCLNSGQEWRVSENKKLNIDSLIIEKYTLK